MKKSLTSLLLILLLIPTAHAKIAQLEQNIANNINAVLWDTINEGEVMALVAESESEEPVMSCKVAPHKSQAGKGVAKCDVEFAVESGPSDERVKCRQSCFLISVYDLSSLKVLSENEALIESCFETLSSGCD